MDFYPQFNWAVPYAFKEAVEKCFFLAGDTLYDTREAYQVWHEALKHLNYSIQILSPPRGTKSRSFNLNWQSPIQLSLRDYRNEKKECIDSTQGRLLVFLWQGDLTVLKSESPEPQIENYLVQIK